MVVESIVESTNNVVLVDTLGQGSSFEVFEEESPSFSWDKHRRESKQLFQNRTVFFNLDQLRAIWFGRR